jgi:hypothetical protein
MRRQNKGHNGAGRAFRHQETDASGPLAIRRIVS